MPDGLQMGELAPEGESFCPWQVVKKYPHVYIEAAFRKWVSSQATCAEYKKLNGSRLPMNSSTTGKLLKRRGTCKNLPLHQTVSLLPRHILYSC